MDVGNSNEEFYNNNKDFKGGGSGYIDADKDIDEAINKRQVTDADRKKQGLVADQKYMQDSFDKEIKYRKMLDEAHKLNNERLKRIEVLQKAVSTVKTPQAKADIQLVIQAEQTAIMSESLRMQTINEIKDQEARLEQYRIEDGIYEAFGELQ